MRISFCHMVSLPEVIGEEGDAEATENRKISFPYYGKGRET